MTTVRRVKFGSKYAAGSGVIKIQRISAWHIRNIFTFDLKTYVKIFLFILHNDLYFPTLLEFYTHFNCSHRYLRFCQRYEILSEIWDVIRDMRISTQVHRHVQYMVTAGHYGKVCSFTLAASVNGYPKFWERNKAIKIKLLFNISSMKF